MKRKSPSPSDHPDPSRRDIRDACERIQSGWSETERRKRAGLPRSEPWLPPLITSYPAGELETELEA
jgi:hypothetical protein